MTNRTNVVRGVTIFVGITVLVFVLIYGGISLTKNLGKSPKVITAVNAKEALDKIYGDININTVAASKAQVNIETTNVKDTLPDISKYPPQVDKTTDSYVEIFSSTEKAGSNKDGWLVDTANDFNKANKIGRAHV